MFIVFVIYECLNYFKTKVITQEMLNVHSKIKLKGQMKLSRRVMDRDSCTLIPVSLGDSGLFLGIPRLCS